MQRVVNAVSEAGVKPINHAFATKCQSWVQPRTAVSVSAVSDALHFVCGSERERLSSNLGSYHFPIWNPRADDRLHSLKSLWPEWRWR